ncbi:MAG: hypothetical protein ABI386_08650 [Rhodanobacter sp.]
MSIQLHIERLVLDEALLDGERAPAVRAAIEEQLGRLLAAPGALMALQQIGSVDGLPPSLLPAASGPSDRLGPRIAMAVQRGLGVASVPVQGGQGAST